MRVNIGLGISTVGKPIMKAAPKAMSMAFNQNIPGKVAIVVIVSCNDRRCLGEGSGQLVVEFT